MENTESTNRCTLLIDGNWLLMSRMFAFKDYFLVGNSADEKTAGKCLLQDMLAKSINITINKFNGVVDNVVLVRDGGSWRKHIEKPAGYTETYKANRVKDSDLDWSYIYGALDSLADAASENGVTVSMAFDIEGDDWIWWWSRELNKKGVNCIIWSIDADLKQLVTCKNGVFTAWYENKPGLVLHKDMQLCQSLEQTIDMFMSYDTSLLAGNPLIKSLQLKCNKITYIDPADIIMKKVVCGDAGDNIKPVLQYENKGKTCKITENQWNKCANALKINGLDDFFNKTSPIAECIVHNKRSLPVSTQHVKDMLEYNKRLVWLDASVYPEHILEKMRENAGEYKTGAVEYMRYNYKTLASKKHDDEVAKIFEGADGLPF